jgi:hypothetical protein
MRGLRSKFTIVTVIVLLACSFLVTAAVDAFADELVTDAEGSTSSAECLEISRQQEDPGIICVGNNCIGWPWPVPCCWQVVVHVEDCISLHWTDGLPAPA